MSKKEKSKSVVGVIDSMHTQLKKIGDGKDIPVKNKGVILVSTIDYGKEEKDSV